MNQPWQVQKQKNWQWRIIIGMSLLLLFGKEVTHYLWRVLAIDQIYAATTAAANRAGLLNNTASSQMSPSFKPQLIIDVKNDTANAYTIQTKTTSGQLNYSGGYFAPGEVKRFIVEANDASVNAIGDIFFQSSTIPGSHNTTCQEIHVLNYDLKYANLIKQPLAVKLSSIASRLECKDNK